MARVRASWFIVRAHAEAIEKSPLTQYEAEAAMSMTDGQYANVSTHNQISNVKLISRINYESVTFRSENGGNLSERQYIRRQFESN